MSSTIGRVAVLGAGTMCAAIAGHCANAGIPVYLWVKWRERTTAAPALVKPLVNLPGTSGIELPAVGRSKR